MIAQVRNRRGRGRPDFRDITEYISAENKALAIRISPALTSRQTAAQEMAHVAQRNVRCTNPVYHYVLSWPNADDVTHEQIFDSVERSLRKLGISNDYQWVAAIHGDSMFAHVHVLVNRVHPETYLQLSIGYDHTKLSQFCREQEQRHGWRPGQGLYTLDPVTGEIVRRKHGVKRALNSRAVDSEIWTGHSSFQRWIAGFPASMARQALAQSNWESVHAALGRFGLAYELYGRGAIVSYQSGKRTLRARAGDLGAEFTLPAMQAKLGRYTPRQGRMPSDRSLTYDAQRSAGALRTEAIKDPAIAALFERYESEVERWRTRIAVQRRERWAEHRRDASERIRQHQQTRKRVQEALRGPSVLPKAFLRATAQELLKEDHEAVLAANRAQRAAITSLYKAPPSLFRLWLKYRAKAGDPDARAVLGRLRESAPLGREHVPPILGEITHLRKAPMADELSGTLAFDEGFDRTPIRKALESDLNNAHAAIVDLNRTREQRRNQEAPPGITIASAQSAGISDDDVARLAAMYRLYVGKDAIPHELWREQVERERIRITAHVRLLREKLALYKEPDSGAAEMQRATQSMLAMESVFARVKLQKLFETERTMIGQMMTRARVPSLKEFLAFHAPIDEAAKALLQTNEFTQADLSEYFIDPKHIKDFPAAHFTFENLSHAIDEYGSVTYKLASSEQEFTDKGGRFNFDKVDRETIRLGLLLGRQKWLDGIEVSGTDAFKTTALREAVLLGITITNPELQPLREQLMKERDAGRQSLHEEWLAQEREREMSPITFHATPQLHEQARTRALQDAAIATAQARGFKVGPLRQHDDYIEGTILGAWSFSDRGFVLAKGDHGNELVMTSVSRALEAYERINENAHDLREDLEIRRPAEHEHENIPRKSLELAR